MLEPSPENNLALEAAESEPEALGEAAGSECIIWSGTPGGPAEVD